MLIVVLVVSASIPSSAVGTEKTYGQVLFDLGIITGSNGDIKEADLITREEMVTILTRLLDGDTSFTPPTTPTFKDVPATHWAYKNIELAYSKGLTTGVGNGLFGLGAKINNNQASLFFLRSLGYDTSDIDYNKASSVIAEKYGLTLGKMEAGSKELIRGQVFELLAKTLDMHTKYNPSKKKIDLLQYESNKIEAFKLYMESTVLYKDQKPETVVAEKEEVSINTLHDYILTHESSLYVNDVNIDFELIDVDLNENGEIGVFAYVDWSGAVNFLDAQEISLQNIAEELRLRSVDYYYFTGKNVYIFIILADTTKEDPSAFIENYLYDETINYDDSKKEWQVIYPLILVDNFSDTFDTWEGQYSY